MIACPKCGRAYHESRQCPAFGGRPVCCRCCRKCEDYDLVNFRCRWQLRHPTVNRGDELAKLDRIIERKAAQMEWYYTHNKPWIAEKIEIEMNKLKRQKAELLEKTRNEQVQKGN